MRENLVQRPAKGEDGRWHLNNDWYPHGVPPNVVLSENIYIETSYGFAGFGSTQPDALIMEEGSGLYEIATFRVSEKGKVKIGKFAIVNGATIICNQRIEIGDHCMVAWGAIISDTWLDPIRYPLEVRREILLRTAHDPLRPYPIAGESKPVLLEENCWVGFGAVILPGVQLGRGCVVGCKTVISEDVPPYAIVAGNPAKIIKYLNPDDSDELKTKLLSDINKQH